jgi:hypothetical protein
VAVRADRDPQPVRRFECFTADLYRLADWLQSCGVKTVALPSTGVYRIPWYDILEERGFEVYLVNARHTKNLPGRKSDVQKSQWLLKLHTHGLLNNSFHPTSEIRVLRTYWRLRAQHLSGAATCIQRMQKALTQMNIQLAKHHGDGSLARSTDCPSKNGSRTGNPKESWAKQFASHNSASPPTSVQRVPLQGQTGFVSSALWHCPNRVQQ